MCLGMTANNLPSNKLHAPDAATAQLYLPGMTAINQLPLTNMVIKRRTVLQASQRIQHLWYSIVGEHGEFVDIVKLSIALALEACP